jgi:hypothetical protein
MTLASKDQLDIVLQRLSSGESQVPNPYQNFSLVVNPFPSYGQFIEGVSVGQEQIKQEFARLLQELYRDQHSRRMVITGTTGAGKTNLLRDFEARIKGVRLPYVFINQPQSGYLEIHRQMISQLGALFYHGLYDAEFEDKVDFKRLPAEIAGLNPELVTALDRMSPYQRNAQLSLLGPSLQTLQTLDAWLQGAKLSPTEKKRLGGVTADVGKSSTVAIKLLGDLIRIFRYAGLFKGLVILLDEFEQIFVSGSKQDQARYAQDIRNLVDTLAEGIIFVIATSPLSDDLKQISPALFRRLGESLMIEPIRSPEEALSYAAAYVEHGRRKFEAEMERQVVLPPNCAEEDNLYFPLSRSEIVGIYEGLRQQSGNVIPGNFLPELNRKVYQVVFEKAAPNDS